MPRDVAPESGNVSSRFSRPRGATQQAKAKLPRYVETSAVAAFRADLVHLDLAKDLPEPPDLSGGSPYFLEKSMATGWPGYSGNVSEASAEKGKEIVRISEDGIVKLVENWLKHDQVPGSW